MKPRTNSIILKGDCAKNIRKILLHTHTHTHTHRDTHTHTHTQRHTHTHTYTHITSTRESKIHFWKIKMVTGKVFSHLCCIISQFFCTFARRGASEVLQKATFFSDLPRKGKRTETFYTPGKNIVLPYL
jgi:hypothetical protein